MLAAAADGLYAEPVLAVLDALVSEDASPDHMEGAIAALLGMGHRSGEDTLRGLAAALEWARSRAGDL